MQGMHLVERKECNWWNAIGGMHFMYGIGGMQLVECILCKELVECNWWNAFYVRNWWDAIGGMHFM